MTKDVVVERQIVVRWRKLKDSPGVLSILLEGVSTLQGKEEGVIILRKGDSLTVTA